MVASLLRRDASRIIKTVLAGTATQKFTDTIEGVFGLDEPDDMREAFEEAPEEEEVEDVEDVPQASTSATGTKRKHSSTSSTGGKRKPSHPTRGGICSLESADIYYPSTADEGSYLHAGVDAKYISSRKSSAHTLLLDMGVYSVKSLRRRVSLCLIVMYSQLRRVSCPLTSVNITSASLLDALFVEAIRGGGPRPHGWST